MPPRDIVALATSPQMTARLELPQLQPLPNNKAPHSGPLVLLPSADMPRAYNRPPTLSALQIGRTPGGVPRSLLREANYPLIETHTNSGHQYTRRGRLGLPRRCYTPATYSGPAITYHIIPYIPVALIRLSIESTPEITSPLTRNALQRIHYCK